MQNNTVPVALPYDATVTLKTDRTMSGQMKVFDQQQSMITLERNEKFKKIAIPDIKKVKFGRKVKLIHSGKIVIRGGGNKSSYNKQNKCSLDKAETWQEPSNHFKITNAQDGKAEVILSKIGKSKLRGIIAVSQTNTYVIDELDFNHDNNNIILTVIPCSE